MENKPNFPLWSPKIELPVFGPEEEPPAPLGFFEAIWARFSLSGLWFFLDWVVYPFINWIIVPWWRWCVYPLIAPFLEFIVAAIPTDDPLAAEKIAEEAVSNDL